MPRLVTIALAALAAALAVSAAAQTAGAPPPPAYRPGLGDLMTATVQPRHAKLGLAGRQNNWTYAAYELHQLDEAFDRLSVQWPQWQRVRIAELVETMIREPIDGLGEAIEAHDEVRFAAAYARLTDACNACHQAAKRAFVVITEPRPGAFPDQDLAPKDFAPKDFAPKP